MSGVRTSDFDYRLPPELIAQEPTNQRDQSRLLVTPRHGGPLAHRRFSDLPEYLRAGDVLVLNDSRVIPARLRGVNALSGGEFEILLLEENATNDWWAMMRPGKRARVGTEITIKALPGSGASDGSLASPAAPATGWRARVMEINGEGHRRLTFSGSGDISAALEACGEVPLPPYIERATPNVRAEDRERYQTVYARAAGSVAAPTAGLHFTEPLLDRIRSLGVEVCHITLHVGLGTFAPVKAESLEGHAMHEERFGVSISAAERINAARRSGRRVVAIGTTTVRVLESLAARHDGLIIPGEGRTRIFIYPPFRFAVVDALVTNFHLPCSTLLMLVSAFAAPGEVRGREFMLSAYAEAVRQRYRFFSYGDAMLIL
jgi:S-adenosylmethionine:tRNA ribosyltransferase-isomerase